MPLSSELRHRPEKAAGSVRLTTRAPRGTRLRVRTTAFQAARTGSSPVSPAARSCKRNARGCPLTDLYTPHHAPVV
jgi:hypothetical protein